MKICPKCHAQVNDNSVFCSGCGVKFDITEENSAAAQQSKFSHQSSQSGYTMPYPGFTDPYDHTSSFDTKDISENKVLAMIAYIMGTIGIIIALLGGTKSPYTAFHVRQALKLEVLNILLAAIALVLCVTIIVPISCAIMLAILFVIRIICFFQVCSGKAKEPYIIRNLSFMK